MAKRRTFNGLNFETRSWSKRLHCSRYRRVAADSLGDPLDQLQNIWIIDTPKHVDIDWTTVRTLHSHFRLENWLLICMVWNQLFYSVVTSVTAAFKDMLLNTDSTCLMILLRLFHVLYSFASIFNSYTTWESSTILTGKWCLQSILVK